MTDPDPAEIAAKLTRAQREYILDGPYHHWTQTRRALERKGIKGLVGMRGFNELGNAVRAHLKGPDNAPD